MIFYFFIPILNSLLLIHVPKYRNREYSYLTVTSSIAKQDLNCWQEKKPT
jgi:hypothetical protein